MSLKRAGGGVKRTFLEDDDRRRLASERHFGGWDAVGIGR